MAIQHLKNKYLICCKGEDDIYTILTSTSIKCVALEYREKSKQDCIIVENPSKR